MKNIRTLGIFSLLLLLSMAAKGQASNVTSAWNFLRYGELDKAKTAIDAASENESTKGEPKTWLYRGQVYETIARSKKPEHMKLSDDPAGEAVRSYIKSMELDAKKRYTNEALAGVQGQYVGLQGLSGAVGNRAIEAYNKQDYSTALNGFETYMQIMEAMGKATGKPVMDTAILYYAGYSAYAGGNKEKAKQYFTRLANDYKYKDASVYLVLAEYAKEEKDTVKALTILDQGMKQASDKKNILVDRLNVFIKQGKTEQAIQEGKQALQLDPNNISIYLALGTIYQNLKREKEAEEVYQQALAKDPDNFQANNLIGVNYYNMGAELYNKSIDTKDLKKATKMEEDAKALWRKAVPYLEKAHNKKPDDKETTNLLAEMYAKLGDLDKAQKIKSGK